MRRSLLILTKAILLCTCAIPCQAQTIPPLKAKALDESEVVLPKPGGQQLLILVLGFSHKSGDNCGPWGRRISTDFASDPRVMHYQIPVLASAPSFVRPMILRGMRKSLPPAEQSHFVPVTDHEAEWKKLVNFSAPDDPYILIAAPDGHVLWQTHGLVTDSAYADLKAAISKFSSNSLKPSAAHPPAGSETISDYPVYNRGASHHDIVQHLPDPSISQGRGFDGLFRKGS